LEDVELEVLDHTAERAVSVAAKLVCLGPPRDAERRPKDSVHDRGGRHVGEHSLDSRADAHDVASAGPP
jgi:hypothetical protein